VILGLKKPFVANMSDKPSIQYATIICEPDHTPYKDPVTDSVIQTDIHKLQDHLFRSIGQMATSLYEVTAWRWNDIVAGLLKRAAMALSGARAEHSRQCLAL